MAEPEQVRLAPQPVSRYRDLLGDVYEPIAAAAAAARENLGGRTVWNVNSTARGGGVAEMLRAYLPYVLDSGVDTRWVVLKEDPSFFVLTKRIHNQLHGDPGDGGPLGQAERDAYLDFLADSSARLASRISPEDVVLLHDPQTAGLIPAILETGARVIWRCHIGVDESNQIALGAQELLSDLVSAADGSVFSRPEYVWSVLDRDTTTVIPPGIDAFTPKNQEMDESTLRAVLGRIGLSGDDPGSNPRFTRSEGDAGEVTRRASILQTGHLPPEAPLVAQVSRWDRLKDHSGLLTLFSRDLRNPDAHLALVGPESSGVDDDPEGASVFREIVEIWESLPDPVRARVHLVSLPMDDLDENGFMVNAIQRRADVVVQKSLAEGFGLTVSEAMWKSRPMVASRLGGIQDQIEAGVSGLLVDDPRDLPAFAAAIDGLLDNPGQAARIGDCAHETVRSGLLSVHRLVRHYELIDRLASPRLL